MSKKPTAQIQTRKKKILITLGTAISIVILSFLGLWIYNGTRTYPLGDKLEYIGKQDYGCYISLTICDSNPSSIYYYATDMGVKETISYFSKASLEHEPHAADGRKTYFGLRAPSGETIYTYHHQERDNLIKKYGLKVSEKAYVLEIPSFKYNAAKSSL